MTGLVKSVCQCKVFTTNEKLNEGYLVWLIEGSIKRYRTLAQVRWNIDGCDLVIRTAIVRKSDGVYKRPVVMLAPLLARSDDFAILQKSRAGETAAAINY